MIKALTAKIKASFFIPHIVYVLAIGFVVRLILSNFGTLSLDHGTFIAWSVNLAENGIKNFYNGWSDYLPGYLYVLWFLGKVRGMIPDTLLYKLPAIIADVATSYLIFKVLKEIKGEKWGITGSMIYLFNPAIISNSTLWGQADSLTAFFSLLSIYLLPKNYFLSALSLSIGTLVKPQAAFTLPIIIFLFLKNKWKYSKMIFYALTSFTVFVLAFIPFSTGNLATFIIGRLGISLSQYPYTSVNAFNFWGLFGFWNKDYPIYQLAGYILVLGIFIFLVIKLWKEKNIKFILSAVIFATSFLFFTRIHERHLLPVFAPLAVSSILNPLFLIPYIGLSIVYVANLYYSYNWVTYDFQTVFSPMVINLIIMLGILSSAFMVFILLNGKKAKDLIGSIVNLFEKGRKKVTVKPFESIKLSSKKIKVILGIVLTFSFLTRVISLGTPPKDYFDEIYHAFTARLVLHGDAKAWEWWNPHPEGFAYEWTHPPFSKLAMALSMKVFGENAFGWRIPQAIVGTLSVFMIYLLTKKIFDDDLIAIFASVAFSLDGLPLVLSRMGMNDIYVLFFMLTSVYFFLKGRDFLSAITLGLALSSKWSGVWTIPILFVIWLKRKKKFKLSILWFLVLPISVYLLSYLPMFLTGHDLGTWWGMQQQMWWYHTGLDATHPYTSPWWSWTLMERPIYLYTSDEVNGMVSRIYAMGNPLIFWFGLTSIIVSLFYAYSEKNKELGLVVFSYLIFFVPWAASPRIMFLYHYLPSIPFMCMAIAYILRRNIKLALPIFISSLVLFIYFYPHWAGLQIPLWLDKSYYWVSSWR